jgi:hypothetical protein
MNHLELQIESNSVKASLIRLTLSSSYSFWSSERGKYETELMSISQGFPKTHIRI